MRLIYKRGSERISFPIDDGETYIGRKDYCEIYFPDGSLSKRHCRLLREGDRLWVFDAGSRNGTLLNGELVEEAELRNGDELQCGKLRFRVDGIPDPDDSYQEFELLDESIPGAPPARGSRASRGSRPSRGSLVTARAVASTEARPSMLDVLPELPPSMEQSGYDELGSEGTPVGATLKLVEGGPPQTWDLSGEVITIGSKEENAVAIQGEGVSRYHAEICQEDGLWLLKDLGARNGIFIAGERIDIHELKDGDELQIGTCKLRFQIKKPNPFDEVNKVLKALINDPLGSFKNDPRVRMGGAAVVVALILLVLSIAPGGGGWSGPGGPSTNSEYLREGTELMVAGKYREARTVFRKLKLTVSTGQQRIPRTLEKACGLWLNAHKVDSFRWEKAADVLKECARLSGLPSELQAWIRAQDEQVRLNLAARKTLTEAETLGAQAGDQARNKNFDSAFKTWTQAINKATQVDPASRFAKRGQEQAKIQQRAAYNAAVVEARARISSQNPDWSSCIELLVKANPFVDGKQQRAMVRKLMDRCERNRRDEQAYMRAVRIVQDRIVDRYPEAIKLLEQINRRSRVYPDAQAYMEWIDADLQVRAAKRAYDLGDARRAFTLLAQALQHEVLGPEAKNSVRERRQKWGRVVRAYKKGNELLQQGKDLLAKEEFERVIRNEPNQSNRFHARSREWLVYIQKKETYTLNRKIKEGRSALNKGRWDSALRWFREVSQDANRTPRDLENIRRQVKKIAKERRLLKNAERDFLYDRTERFVTIRDILKLLYLWLPRGHPDKKEARKLLTKVVSRLKNWKKSIRGSYRGSRR